MSEPSNDERNGNVQSLTGSKRVDALIFGLIVSAIGASGLTVTKDTSDRFYGEDARRLKAEVITRIDREEVESRQRDTDLKNDISSLRTTITRQDGDVLRNKFQTEKHETLLDKLDREIDEHIRSHK